MEDYIAEAFDIEIVSSPSSADKNLTTVRGALAIDIATTVTRLPDVP
jgi:hypothetical protein